MLWGTGRVVLIAAALGLAGVAAHRVAVQWHPSPKEYPVQGVDVDEAQGAIDWGALRGAGAGFGYARATDGANVRDTRFQENWQGMADAHLQRGALLHFSFCQPAVAQADAFNTVVPRDPDALPPVVAIDLDGACTRRPERAALLGDLQALLSRIERHAGKEALLKPSRAAEQHYRLTDVLARNVWEERNFVAPDYSARPWRLWQASDMRQVDGVETATRWSVVAK